MSVFSNTSWFLAGTAGAGTALIFSLGESILGAGGAGIQNYVLVGGEENDGVHLQAVLLGGEGEGGGGQTGEVEQHLN